MQSMQMRLNKMKTGFSAIVIVVPKDKKIIVKIVIESEYIWAINEEFKTVNNNSQLFKITLLHPTVILCGFFFFKF